MTIIREDKHFHRWIKRIRECTDENDHSGAVVHMVSGYPVLTGHLVQAAIDVVREHVRLGHMPPELHAKREAIIREAEAILHEGMTYEMLQRYNRAF